MSLQDPKITLKTLLDTGWNTAAVGFKPARFSNEWFEPTELGNQVVVTHVTTPMTYIGIGNQRRRYDGVYAIDVWAAKPEGSVEPDQVRFKMGEEVDRVIHANNLNPGAGLSYIALSNWRDLDELDKSPKIFRSRIELLARYYKT